MYIYVLKIAYTLPTVIIASTKLQTFELNLFKGSSENIISFGVLAMSALHEDDSIKS